MVDLGNDEKKQQRPVRAGGYLKVWRKAQERRENKENPENSDVKRDYSCIELHYFPAKSILYSSLVYTGNEGG